MAEDKEDKKGFDRSQSDGLDVNDISVLSSLTKKYGLSEEIPEWISGDESKPHEPFEPKTQTAQPPVFSQPTFRPKNNSPARTPRVVYNRNTNVPSINVLFDGDAPQGPEGRRVIYAEQETESIAEKRKRNAEARRTQKGSVGFGSQPYVRHVASSDSAIKSDDPTVFSRAYAVTRNEPEKYSPLETKEIPVSQQLPSKGHLVATDSSRRGGGDLGNGSPAKKNNDYTGARHKHYEMTAGEKAARFFGSFLPWKGDSAKEVIRKIVMDLSAIAIIVCFGYFVNNYLEHRNELKSQNDIKQGVSEVESSEEDALWAQIKAKYPNVDFPDGMNIKYAELYAKNQDLVGWLTVDGTNIDTSVLHHAEDAKTNAEQDLYLRHDFYGNYNKYGNAYLDRYNSGLTLDRNNTIYGHNMTDGLAFAQLEKYYETDGFLESPIIKYSTLFNDYYFKIYAVIVTNGYKEGDNGYLFDYTVCNFASTENFTSFIEALDERKLYDTGVDINENDTLITLSTCSYEIKEQNMGRLAVIGRMVRSGESLEIDASKVKENENIRYPQIWYDEHDMDNPYADAYKWYPE